jgi:glyceraldehyde 3-phosphate dehydrogenase
MAKVAINGLGRIGRATLKLLLDHPEIELAAANDLVPADTLAYLLNYDTVYGRFSKRVEAAENSLRIDGRRIQILSKKDPADLPWSELGVELVFECTGIFRTRDDCQKHIDAGARHVILSAPARDKDVPTFVYGVNDLPDEVPQIFDCASCTTNCIAPVAEIMQRRVGVRKAAMTTTHAYTSTQGIVDGPAKRLRRGRAAAANLVPTSTGAAKATSKALEHYRGIFDGAAIRVPVPCGSIADLTFVTERSTTVDEVKGIFREEAATQRYEGVLGASEEPIVSSDIIGDQRASVVDLDMIQVIDKDLVKIMSWYDNEWGYSSQMVRMAAATVKRGQQPVG